MVFDDIQFISIFPKFYDNLARIYENRFIATTLAFQNGFNKSELSKNLEAAIKFILKISKNIIFLNIFTVPAEKCHQLPYIRSLQENSKPETDHIQAYANPTEGKTGLNLAGLS